MMQSRPSVASWRPRQAARSAVALRHERPNAWYRRRYYAHHWPDLAGRDLFEQPGRWAVVWTGGGILGLAATVAAPLLGDDAVLVGWLNVGVFALLLAAHAVNAVRTRRRRSVLLTPVLLLALGVGAVHMVGGSDPRWLDILAAVFLVWIPIATADLVAPRRTYLAAVRTPG
jgi:hypothetical protein